MKHVLRHLHSFRRRGLHDVRIVVASRALRTRDNAQRLPALVLHVTRGARPVLHYVRFVERVLLVTSLALLVDRREIQSFAKPVTNDGHELLAVARDAGLFFVTAL